MTIRNSGKAHALNRRATAYARRTQAGEGKLKIPRALAARRGEPNSLQSIG